MMLWRSMKASHLALLFERAVTWSRDGDDARTRAARAAETAAAPPAGPGPNAAGRSAQRLARAR